MKKCILFIGLWVLAGVSHGFAQDLLWENIGKEISGVNVVLVDRLNPKYIYLGTARGLLRSEDSGNSWRLETRLNKDVKFLLQDNKSLIYAVCQNGLFMSQDQGRSWEMIFRVKNSEENYCQALVVTNEGIIYLGTNSGLFISKDQGRIWHKESGKLGSAIILAIAQDRLNNVIYVVSTNKVFRYKEGGCVEIFVTGTISISEQTENIEEANIEKPVFSSNLKYITVDPNSPSRVYLSTESGVYVSQDQGTTWNSMTDFGLLSKKVKFILCSQSSKLYAINSAGVFVYQNERWEELSLRLPVADVRFLAIDNQDNLYAATDKGIFRAAQVGFSASSKETDDYFKNEPGIRELHEAAIKYAQVIDPQKIENLRNQARIKAILPEVSLDYDRTVTSYSNTTSTRFTVGPSDWGVSLKWSLSDLIWSEQQRLIDSQVRLMVEMRPLNVHIWSLL